MVVNEILLSTFLTVLPQYLFHIPYTCRLNAQIDRIQIFLHKSCISSLLLRVYAALSRVYYESIILFQQTSI